MGEKKLKDRLFEDFPSVTTNEWKSIIERDLKGKEFDKTLVWKTYEGFDLQPFYRKEGTKSPSPAPGEFPFLRGNDTKENNWLINENVKEPNPAKANKEAINYIKNGADSITFNPETAKNGKALSTLLKKIDIEKVSINFSSEKSVKDILPLLSKLKETKNTNLRGFSFFDPLNHMVLNGLVNEKEYEEIKNCINLSKDYNYRVFAVHSGLFKSSGSNIAQELAFTLNSAVEYISRLIDHGLNIDLITKKMTFSFSINSNFFMEIAKLRAARLLWAKIINQYKPKEKQSCKMYIHAHTADFNKTIYDPHVNILRGATEAMSASIGGADSITVNPFDLYYKEPDQFSKRVSRNTQLILKNEAYFDKVVDPGAGSYYIETLTNSLAKESLTLFQKIEKSGGFIENIKQGTIHEKIKSNRTEVKKDIAKRKKVFLGTNKYPNIDETISEKIIQTRNLRKDKESEFEPLVPERGSTVFEKLRLNTERTKRKKPKVFLLQLGNLAMRNARANFSRNFFGCAGFEIIDSGGFETIEEGVKTALKSKAEIVVICSSNKEYLKFVPEVLKNLKKKKPEILFVVAGYSKELLKTLEDEKVEDFIHSSSDTIKILTKYQNLLGISVS